MWCCVIKLWNVWLWIKLFCRWGRKWEWKFSMSSWIRRLLISWNRIIWCWIRCVVVWFMMDWIIIFIVIRFVKRWLFLKCVIMRCVVVLLFCCRKSNFWCSRWVIKMMLVLSWIWVIFWFCCWKIWFLIRWMKWKVRCVLLSIRCVMVLISVSWRLFILSISRCWMVVRWVGVVFRSCLGFSFRY